MMDFDDLDEQEDVGPSVAENAAAQAAADTAAEVAAAAKLERELAEKVAREAEAAAAAAAAAREADKAVEAAPAEAAPAEVAQPSDQSAARAADDEAVKARLRVRCQAEMAKKPKPWTAVTMEQFQAKCMEKAEGMNYGLAFPWNPAMLKSNAFGPEWLTRAFHAAGTLPPDNAVVAITNVKNFVGGGACSKMMFDVEYSTPDPMLHTKLFAKIPFDFNEPSTKSDRVASSVMQQGMDYLEIATSRLMEGFIPFRVPRFYFGDISNETTNCILITERVPFADPDFKREKLEAFEIEGPYEKMRDWELRGDHLEYYDVLMRNGAKVAGHYKAGKMGEFAVLNQFFPLRSDTKLGDWGIRQETSGLPDKEFDAKIKMGVAFVSEVSKVLYPADCITPEDMKRYEDVLRMINMYSAEITYWAGKDADYCAFTHGNLNVDNVYFWRDELGKLECGLLDWGGCGANSLGDRLWWWLYCAEYEVLRDHLDSLFDTFIDSYESNGGPRLDKAKLRQDFELAALLQGVGLLGAVPQIYRMCKKTTWPEIKDRRDPRIAENVDGKNTLRIYVGTFINIIRMIHDWRLEATLERFVEEFHRSEAGRRIRRKGTPLQVRPEPATWKVVGGESTGGIMVRADRSTTSAQLPERLSSGAIVQEQALAGERLHYRLLSGTGPATGWVSLKVSGKDLLIKA